MPKDKMPQVAESPIADVFEGRHPSDAEKQWAEKTLAPTLEKAPERPIGAATGVNLDEHGHARFPPSLECRFGVSTRRPIFQKTGAQKNILDSRGRPRIPVAFTPAAIAASFSRCGSSQVSRRRKRLTSAISTCCKAGEADCR